MPVLPIDDLGVLAEAMPANDRFVLIGERAIEFWVRALCVRNGSSGFLEATIADEPYRLLGPAGAALSLAQALGGTARLAIFDDELSHVTALVAGESNGCRWAVELQSDLRGFDRDRLEQVRRSAMPIVPASGRQGSVHALHPVHCLREQLEEAYGYLPGRRREPASECQMVRVDLAIEVCRRVTQHHLDEGDLAGAMRLVEALYELSVTPAALYARVSNGVRVESAIVDSEAYPTEFRRTRLRYFRRMHRRKVHVYRRRFGHPSRCVAVQS